MGLLDGLIDRAGNFVKSMIDSAYKNKVNRIMEDSGDAHKSFGMEKEEFVEKASKLAVEDPDRFQSIMKYDVRKSSFRKYDIW